MAGNSSSPFITERAVNHDVMSRWAIGIDLGGTAIKAALVTERDGQLSDLREPTAWRTGSKGVIAQVADMVLRLYYKGIGMAAGNFAGVGLGAPGAVDVQQGILSYPPNLPGWEVVRLRDELEAELLGRSGQSIAVMVDNDANAAALGEAWYGAGRNHNTFFMITLGTGVGGGIVLDRKLYRGGHGTAGEIGFTIIDAEGEREHAGIKGTLEGMIGKKGMLDLARQMIAESASSSRIGHYCNGDFSSLSPRHLEYAAKEGDALALSIWERIGSLLGIGLANIAVLMDIRKFIVGGGIAGAGNLIFDAATRRYMASTLPTMHHDFELIPALLGNGAGVHGAAALCFA